MRAYERFIKYVTVGSASAEGVEHTPSTEGQLKICAVLADEMRTLGFTDVYEDGRGYVYGRINASEGFENAPLIGLIAHVDTAPDFSGENVRPQIIDNYDGGDIRLGDSGLVLSPDSFPDLKDCLGQTLICTDGTTLLGADDKAGIAEIISACEALLKSSVPHGAVAVCFTPDEEIGHGAALLDLERFGADFAYTLDGDSVNELNFETFNAAAAHWEIRGVNVHTGTAKGIMINAALVAAEINALLPQGERPENTEGYEGFFHLAELNGRVEQAEMKHLIRDHDDAGFDRRCRLMEDIERQINLKYGEGTAKLKLIPQYRNMADVLKDRPEVVNRAVLAMEKTGLKPDIRPIRGGTDGAQLSFRGLPCPNLGTGGAAFHGPYEHITAENMDKAVEVLLNLLRAE